MNKEELKKILKPIVMESVKECLFEGGVLSSIISEVAVGLSSAQLKEAPAKIKQVEQPPSTHMGIGRPQRQELTEHKKKLLDAIGKDSYNGVNIFEGVSPMDNTRGSEPSVGSPLAGTDPSDAGVDISGILAIGGRSWSSLIK